MGDGEEQNGEQEDFVDGATRITGIIRDSGGKLSGGTQRSRTLSPLVGYTGVSSLMTTMEAAYVMSLVRDWGVESFLHRGKPTVAHHDRRVLGRRSGPNLNDWASYSFMRPPPVGPAVGIPIDGISTVVASVSGNV